MLAFFSSDDNEKTTDSELMISCTPKMNSNQKDASLIGPNTSGYTINVAMLQPKSKGTVTLDPQNPNNMPIIDINYLSDENDIKTYLGTVKRTLRMFDASVLKEYLKNQKKN